MSDYSAEDLERDYYLGAYQTCVNKANSMPASRKSIYYMCLSYCHMKKWDNLKRELEKASSTDLDDDEDDDGDSDRTFVDILKLFKDDASAEGGDEKCVKALDEMDKKKSIKQDDELSRLLASGLYARHKAFAKALQVIDHFDTLRASHAKITVYMMMNRLDLAEKQLEKMQKKDELAPITELTSALLRLLNRNPTQAWRLALGLSDRHRPSPLLNNIQTAAAICLGDYDSAKQLCESSLDMDNDNPEAIINMIHILQKTKSSAQAIERNLERLKDLYPKHEFITELESIATEMAA